MFSLERLLTFTQNFSVPLPPFPLTLSSILVYITYWKKFHELLWEKSTKLLEYKIRLRRIGATCVESNYKGWTKKTSQSFFTITRSNFTQILKSWTFLNSSSSWLLKNVQDHWIWAKFDRDMAKIKKIMKLWKYGKYIEN